MINRFLLLLGCVLAFPFASSADLKTDAERALERGVKFFHSISTEGGYVWYVSADLTERWGEGVVDERTIEVQPPGTPSVGMAFVRAWDVIRHNAAMRAANEAAAALMRGQNELGGWNHVIHFDKANSGTVSFDDNQTQGAIRFLMEVEQRFGKKEVWPAIQKAVNLMVTSQLANGGWPHQYPTQGNYHDYATFNDQGINDCIQVMIDADTYYSNPRIKSSLLQAARFLMMSQLPPPQPGWAQQYNEYLQPAWARSFEPPSVCPQVTVNNLETLMDLAVYFKHPEYLEPIHDALDWLDDLRLKNGLWARFVEIGTGRPLYYDRGRIRVNSTEELSIERRLGYGYETDLSAKLEKARARFDRLWNRGWEYDREETLTADQRIAALEPRVKAIIAAQDRNGRWITKDDKYKKRVPGRQWDGEYAVQDRISSKVFIDNVETLSEYLKLVARR